jgi:hypothetical protein
VARRWETEKVPRLVGVRGALEILGVQKMTLKRWREGELAVRYFDVPSVQEIHGEEEPAGGPVWVRADVERWHSEHGRRRPGPAPANAAA